MSDLERVLRRLARLLERVDERDGSRVAAEPAPGDSPDRPGDDAEHPQVRHLPRPGAATR